jgi:hypothetical protein
MNWFWAMIVLVVTAMPATADCRQALALGLDVSGSVDSKEYRLQRDGLAAALEDPEIVARLLAMPSAPVQLAVFEWSGPKNQRVTLPWTEITDATTLRRVTDTLRKVSRAPAAPSTALGTAMQTGAALLSLRPGCWKRTLDISGDGKHNMGPHPRDVQTAWATKEITINALVIGADSPNLGDLRQVEIGELSSYLNAYVKTGRDAFVQTALGYEDYQEAMVRKLRRELEGLVLSQAQPFRSAPARTYQ